jgi:Ni/Co efflux regulator RcnB
MDNNHKKCPYCHRTFTYKTELERHTPTCKWIHFANQNKDRYVDTLEKRFTDAQKDQLIRSLVNRVDHMEKELGSVKNQLQQLKRRKYIKIYDWLSKNLHPSNTWAAWLHQSIDIDDDFLLQAINKGVCFTIKQSIEKLLKPTYSPHSEHSQQIPIYAFKQRKNTLYVYDRPEIEEEPKWKTLEKSQFLSELEQVLYKLRNLYLKWQVRNINIIQSSIENQEQDMENSRKILSISAYNNNELGKLFTQVYDWISKDMEEVVVMEEVT